jgi:hypothetical protein
MSSASQYPMTVPDLRARIDDGWASLNARVVHLPPEQLDGPRSPDGWTVKDHLGHIAAWERAAIALMDRQLHYRALDVPDEVYEAGGIDGVNAAMHERARALPAAAVMGELAGVHRQLLDRLEELDDADLARPYHDFVPDAPWEDDGTPMVAWIAGNTYEHYTEHLPWIETILAGAVG